MLPSHPSLSTLESSFKIHKKLLESRGFSLESCILNLESRKVGFKNFGFVCFVFSRFCCNARQHPSRAAAAASARCGTVLNWAGRHADLIRHHVYSATSHVHHPAVHFLLVFLWFEHHPRKLLKTMGRNSRQLRLDNVLQCNIISSKLQYGH